MMNIQAARVNFQSTSATQADTSVATLPSRQERLRRLPLRESLQGLEPYGAPQIDAPVQLNVNENSYGLPAGVRESFTEAVASHVSRLHRYPERDCTELRTALAQYLGHGLTTEHLWAANGSNEILQQVLQAFGGPGRTAMSFSPSYSMYEPLCSSTATEFSSGYRAQDFTLSVESVTTQIREASPNIVILCSPNNPTGTLLDLDVIEAAYEAGEASQAVVVVDEAYFECTPEGTRSAMTLLPGRERLLVVRTFSKAFACAGLRLGYLAADPAIVDALLLVRLPYHLSCLTQAVALTALTHAEELLAPMKTIRAERNRVSAELRDMGLEPAPSASNFILFRGLSDPEHTWKHLLSSGVLIRHLPSIPGSLRVTIGTEEENTIFLKALRAALLAPQSKKPIPAV